MDPAAIVVAGAGGEDWDCKHNARTYSVMHEGYSLNFYL